MVTNMPLVAVGAMLLMSAVSASAEQTSTKRLDQRWNAYLGCWAPAESADPLQVCVTANAGGGVSVATTVEGKETSRLHFDADGAAHPIVQGDCEGSERAWWSSTGYRVFFQAEVSCSDQTAQKVTGLSTIHTDGSWIEVSSVEAGGIESVRVLRYRRTSGAASALVALSLDEIAEAAAKVPASVLEAAVIHTGTRAQLRGRDLVKLHKKGVPEQVTDALIALSFPETFVVNGPGSYARWTVTRSNAGAAAGEVVYQDANVWTHTYTPWDFQYWGRHDPRHRRWSGYRSWEPANTERTRENRPAGRVSDVAVPVTPQAAATTNAGSTAQAEKSAEAAKPKSQEKKEDKSDNSSSGKPSSGPGHAVTKRGYTRGR
jgi:hypothetical protein